MHLANNFINKIELIDQGMKEKSDSFDQRFLGHNSPEFNPVKSTLKCEIFEIKAQLGFEAVSNILINEGNHY